MKKPLLALLCMLLPLLAGAQKASRPNIVILLADDLGWGDVGYHGSDIRTPNIDRLAAEGLVLDRFYTAPICSPTRAGLMTGRYPDRVGLRQNVIPPWSRFGVDTAELFLPQALAQAGYLHRAALGKWHLGSAEKKYLPLQRGFTHFYGLYNGAFDYFTHQREGELDWHDDARTCRDTGYATDLITEEAVRCIKAYAGAAPFFLYVAYNAPHGPLQARLDDLLSYGFDPGRPLFPHPDAEGSRGRGNTRRQTYAAMVTCMDRGIGRILQALREAHIEDNTVVIFASDNGPARNGGGSAGDLKGWKFQEWSGGVRVPALIRWPGHFKGPRRITQTMGYVDLMPTLLALAGLHQPPPRPFDGINMLPVLRGERDSVDRYFYLGHGAIIHSPWKLVKAHAGNPQMKAGEDRLFNILEDPQEKTDLKARYPGVYQDLLQAVAPYDHIRSARQVPPYGEGRKGFVAPKDWLIR